MLKVNGVTLKDSNGKAVYVTLDKNAQATYKYTIPAGTGGITASKTQRNYKVDAIFVGDNYYPGARNSTSFQVERSTTTVTITQAKVTKTNVLSVKATLKDYKGNNLIGTNKVTIKINGKNYVDPKNGKPKYWSVKNGNVDLTGIQVDPKTTIKRVMLVTGERQAYLEGRAETTNIQINNVTGKNKINTKITLKITPTSPVITKPITYTATLTDENNKPLSNQTVVLKIIEPQFNLKTNNNGVATFTETYYIRCDIWITAIYNGNNYYNPSNTTIEFTVK